MPQERSAKKTKNLRRQQVYFIFSSSIGYIPSETYALYQLQQSLASSASSSASASTSTSTLASSTSTSDPTIPAELTEPTPLALLQRERLNLPKIEDSSSLEAVLTHPSANSSPEGRDEWRW